MILRTLGMKWMLLAALVGCDAPTIAIAPDAAADTAVTDTRSCQAVRAPAGGLCAAPDVDEDLDCIPDSCDDCPSVVQEFAAIGRAPETAGEFCRYPGAALTERLAFDPFNALDPRWRDEFRFFFATERLNVAGGVAYLGHRESERLAFLAAGAGARDVLATAVVRVRDSERFAGLALRASLTTGYLCVLEGFLVSIAAQVCTAGMGCEMRVLSEGTRPLRKPLPADVVADGRLLMRAFAHTTERGVRVDCQIFPAPRTKADVLGTLLTVAASDYTVSGEIVDPVYPSGEVGIVAQRARIEVESLDILTAAGP